MNRSAQLTVLAAVSLVLAACTPNQAATLNQPMLPQVTVAEVLTRPVTDFDQFTGRIAPVERVELRPRVSGYIAAVNFTQGREVRKGQLLFTIDPRPYEAELKRAQAELAHARSAQALAKSENERAVKLFDAHAISREEYDTRVAGNEQAASNVQVAEAAVDTAALNLSFTRVEAPISGLVGKAEITTGNSVTAGQTLLASLVSVDPVYVEFDGDEQAYLKYQALARQGHATWPGANARDGASPLWVGLADEAGHPHQGKLVFLDNQLDPATGTIHARGVLDNHDRVFTPGMFARVQLAGSGQYDALLIRDSAVGTDQSVKFVYVVGADGKVEYRQVKLGPAVDELRVVRAGLKPGETIVVNGLQRVRPGAAVNPQKVAMAESPAGGGMLAASATAGATAASIRTAK